MMLATISPKPFVASCSTATRGFFSSTGNALAATMQRTGCSFSQPRLTTITSPPKFGLQARLRSVRIGIAAPGASMATPQP